MNISAISAYTTKKNTKSVSFGKVDSFHLTTPEEKKGALASKGDLTINGVKGHWAYYIDSDEGESCSRGAVVVTDPKNEVLASVQCSFPKKDLSCVDISNDIYYNKDALGAAAKKFKREFFQDAMAIIYDTASHLIQNKMPNPIKLNKDTHV